MLAGLLRVDEVRRRSRAGWRRRRRWRVGVISWKTIRRTGIFGLQRLDQVPRDGLALAVLIRREVELVGVLDQRLELADLLLAVGADDVERLEVVVDVDAEAAPTARPCTWPGRRRRCAAGRGCGRSRPRRRTRCRGTRRSSWPWPATRRSPAWCPSRPCRHSAPCHSSDRSLRQSRTVQDAAQPARCVSATALPVGSATAGRLGQSAPPPAGGGPSSSTRRRSRRAEVTRQPGPPRWRQRRPRRRRAGTAARRPPGGSGRPARRWPAGSRRSSRRPAAIAHSRRPPGAEREARPAGPGWRRGSSARRLDEVGAERGAHAEAAPAWSTTASGAGDPALGERGGQRVARQRSATTTDSRAPAADAHPVPAGEQQPVEVVERGARGLGAEQRELRHERRAARPPGPVRRVPSWRRHHAVGLLGA